MVDLKLMEQQKAFNKQIGRTHTQGDIGLETSLGHAYSIFVEKAYQNGIDVFPNPTKFVEDMKQIISYSGDLLNAEALDLTAKLHTQNAAGFIKYMQKHKLKSEICKEIMTEIVGPMYVEQYDSLLMKPKKHKKC